MVAGVLALIFLSASHFKGKMTAYLRPDILANIIIPLLVSLDF